MAPQTLTSSGYAAPRSLRDAVVGYKDREYKWINDVLRENDAHRMSDEYQEKFAYYMDALDQLMQPTTEALRLYRGCVMTKDILRRRSLTIPSFVSTSLSPRVARTFTRPALGDNRSRLIPVIFEIEMPVGSRAAVLDEIYDDQPFNTHESEHLLPPGTRLILGWRRKRGGIWRIHTRVAS